MSQRHLGASAIGRLEILVATRCQAMKDVNYRGHRLATVATQLAK